MDIYLKGETSARYIPAAMTSTTKPLFVGLHNPLKPDQVLSILKCETKFNPAQAFSNAEGGTVWLFKP